MKLIIDINDEDYKNIKDYPKAYYHNIRVLGGRHNGKTKELVIEAYKKGWNDCIDAICEMNGIDGVTKYETDN